MDTTELITHTLTVDSISELGNFTEFYFNRQMASCPECGPLSQEFVIQNQPGVMGYSMVEDSTNFTLIGIDQNMILPSKLLSGRLGY